MNLLPKTVSAKSIQRNYRSIFDEAKKTKEPIVVLTNNIPDVAIIDFEEMERVYAKAQESEVRDALSAIAGYEREKKAGKLKVLKSLKDLM